MDKDELLTRKTLASEIHQKVLLAITQPVTTTQLARKTGIPFEQCNNILIAMQTHGLVQCLNPAATRNHLFWLANQGKNIQNYLVDGSDLSHDFPDIDWELYASICFSQRSEVVKTLSFPMQPSQIKRRATFKTPGLRLSGNNVRDVTRYLKEHRIVRPVKLRKKAHPGYELTEIGLHMRRLLLQAEVRA